MQAGEKNAEFNQSRPIYNGVPVGATSTAMHAPITGLELVPPSMPVPIMGTSPMLVMPPIGAHMPVPAPIAAGPVPLGPVPMAVAPGHMPSAMVPPHMIAYGPPTG